MSESKHSDSEFYYPDQQEIVTTGGGDDENENNNNQEEIEDFIKEQKSANTARKTTSDLKTLKRYLQSINKGQIEMVNLPAPELDHLLAKFFKDVHKVNGDEYEPDSVSSFQRSIHRFLTDQKYPHNILKDREFGTSRSVLAAKRKQLVVKHGKGNRPNATRPITDGDEAKLFESGEFGFSNPESLQRTMWWFMSLHFGLINRDESRKLCWGDVELQLDEDGRELLVWLSERGTKNRKGQEIGHGRAFQPKVYATGTNRCPIMMYKMFKSHRPGEMNSQDSPFFLALRHNRKLDSHIWYKKAPLGKNEIGKFMQQAAGRSGLAQRIGGKVSNHSVRKTSISRLLDANREHCATNIVPSENFPAQLSGHKNTQSLQSCKSANEQHQRQMSNILSRTQQPSNKSLPAPSQGPSSHASVPSSSLRLWVPPLRLLSAFMWQVAEQRRVEYYTRLEEFVSVVLEMVPDLMTAKERVELLLGLRATFILELCHDQPSLTLQIMQPHLESISLIAESASIDESGDRTGEVAVRNFVDLIQTLLRSPTYRWQFFQDIYPLHYGPKYDTALQSLVWEFLCRLEKLLPVPSFHQAAYWFNEDSSLLEDSLQIVSDPKKMQILLLHFKRFAHLDPGSSSSPIMADTILSTLSGKAEKCLSTPHETQGSMNEAGRHGDMNEEDRHGDVDEGDIQTELDKEDRHGDLDEGDIQTELDKEDRHGDVDEGDIQTELDEEDRHGDVDEGDIQTELDKEDRHGDVDERDPQRDIDQGWQRDMNEKHQQKVEKKELNGHMIDCENAVDDRGAREVPTSSGEGPWVSSPQGSLPERASQSVNTVAGSASQLLRQVCTQCGKTYLSKSCLIRHQRTHTEEKKAPQLRLTCLECGKSFESKRTLTDHQTTHTGERPYLCSYCGKTFRRKNILTCHIRVHTGERPYGCSVCGRRFMQHSNLVSHKRLHTGERPYLCSFCGKGFPVSGALLVHTRNHTGERPYKCEFCGKGFMDSSRLVKHRRLHTKEKPYVCSVCKKQFWLVSGLKKHMRTHTGEKPHECLFYGKRFSERGNMKIHQRVHR
ncbi:uncharacterized protein LOC105908810 isoform X2 [Clupea harengus]|uniref:Uncharacterized protein LOC105908810 isoform X2 n=1 Tax=Clupea harengus TaxID=7950 RepID=A0A6P8F7G7_CLUHA|nr:uncharacterized protein LOC105908810 isoform X2 [Clupea harengus]